MKKDWNARLVEISQTDREIWQTGRAFAGIDEAGRGPLCGPVAAACVVMPSDPLLLYVDDSKKLTDKKRRELMPIIKEQAIAYGIAFATEQEITACRTAFGSGKPHFKNCGYGGVERGKCEGSAAEYQRRRAKWHYSLLTVFLPFNCQKQKEHLKT